MKNFLTNYKEQIFPFARSRTYRTRIKILLMSDYVVWTKDKIDYILVQIIYTIVLKISAIYLEQNLIIPHNVFNGQTDNGQTEGFFKLVYLRVVYIKNQV